MAAFVKNLSKIGRILVGTFCGSFSALITYTLVMKCVAEEFGLSSFSTPCGNIRVTECPRRSQ